MNMRLVGVALLFFVVVAPAVHAASDARAVAKEEGYHEPLYTNNIEPYLKSNVSGSDILRWNGTTFEFEGADAAFKLDGNDSLEVLTSTGDVELKPSSDVELNPSGNVGVNTEDPSDPLTVNGTLNVTDGELCGEFDRCLEEALTNVTLRHVWDGTDWEPQKATEEGIPIFRFEAANTGSGSGTSDIQAIDEVLSVGDTADAGQELNIDTVAARNDSGLSLYDNAGSGLRVTDGGAVVVNGGTLTLPSGTGVNEFSTDDTLSDNSDDAVPTEQAVKQYADSLEGDESDNQTLTFTRDVSGTNDSLSIVRGNTVTLEDDFEADTTIPDDQNLSVNNDYSGTDDQVKLDNGGAVIVDDDFEANTDNQTLSTTDDVSGTDDSITISSGNSIEIDDDYDDPQPLNETLADGNSTGAYDINLNDNDFVVGGTHTGFVGGGVGVGTRTPSVLFEVNGTMKLESGVGVDEISDDDNLTDGSDTAIPTEGAVKSFIGNDTSDDQQLQPTVRDGSTVTIPLENGGNTSFNDQTGSQTLAQVLQQGNDAKTYNVNMSGENVVDVNKVVAETGQGVALYDDGDNGVFVDDGGNVGVGTETPSSDLHVAGSAELSNGTAVNEFSTDETLSDDSDNAVPTEQAVKQYQESNDFDTWTIAGDSGSSTVNNADTVTVSGGTGIDTSESSRSVTVDVKTGTGVETSGGVVRLSTGAAGSGLGGGGGSALSVNTGNAVTVNSDDVEVATGGIADDEIQNDTVDNSEVENTASFTFNGVTSNADIDAQSNNVDNVECLGDECA